MDQRPESLLITGVRVFDGLGDAAEPGAVLVEGDRIAATGAEARERAPERAEVLDGGGRVLLPGLTDAHVHLVALGTEPAGLATASAGLPHLRALEAARRMLLRGFTAVRDMGGDVAAVKQVIDEGLFPGPRLYPSQAALSQTSGHGDFGAVHEPPVALGGAPSRAEEIGFMRVVDGPDRVLAGAREQLKKGASQLKVMAGGGVASRYDPLGTLQFTPEELRAAVRAAEDFGTYVAAHVYGSAGVRRALEAGVRCIEHGQLADERTIGMLAEHDAWLSTQPFDVDDHHYPTPELAAKNTMVCDGVERTLHRAREHGVRLAFGTDLLAPAEAHRQGAMLARLSRWLSPVEALRIATSGNAALFRMAGERDPYQQVIDGHPTAPLGVIRPGALADLLVVEGDPTRDLGVLADPAANLALVVKGGRIWKNSLD
ncbi:amidohydrolase family protein [Saccharopolyspora cebuensis]|uniref:metal-dependent hydrolase family protein n=1 Tax=Saccharopolyspora cebuensis TaxID=418759 RepID=UPI0031F023C7